MEEKGRQGWKKTVWQLTRELNAVSWLTVPFPTHVMMTCNIRNNRRAAPQALFFVKVASSAHAI
jgi:putative AlgH/UPF0301 family transcriptional regulator